MHTLGFDHVEKVRSARLVPAEQGKYYIHVVLELRADLPIDEEGRLRLHLTDGVNHEYADLLPVDTMHDVAVELEPTTVLPVVKRRQFKKVGKGEE